MGLPCLCERSMISRASSIVFATGITERVGLHIANTAHWAGFAGGVLLGAVWPVRRRPMP